MAQVHEKERQLTREVAQTVEQGLPGVEVLAVELNGPERMTVYIDHATGVDHGLCERVTEPASRLPRPVHGRVSSPGIERPLRTPPISGAAVGHKVSIRTDPELNGRKKFRGTVAAASTKELALDVADGARIDHPVRRDRPGQPRRRR